MKISAIIHGGKNSIITLKSGSTVMDLMVKLGLKPDLYIASLQGKAVPTDITLKDGDKVLLISVVSGG